MQSEFRLMTTHDISVQRTASPNARRIRFVALLAVASLAAGCSKLLDVTNPNQLKESDLSRPASATALANGALATVSNGYSASLLAVSAISDELKWVGSYDSGRDLVFGNMSNPSNEFTMSAFPAMAQARWMADDAITLLVAFDKKDSLPVRSDLARAYIYGAIAYISVGDMWEDFTLSDRRTPAPPLGAAGMGKLYDTAIGYLDQAVTVSRATKTPALEVMALALRARARHARAVRALLTPRGRVPANPLVNDAGAVADARAFLAANADADYKFRFQYSATTYSSTVGAWVNERREFRISDAYVVADATDKQVASVRYTDPITGSADPVLSAAINEFKASRQYGPHTVVSLREMRLILAEAALALGDVPGATAEINNVRSLDGLPAYNPAAPGAPTPLAMLKHERRVNLFMQGRRLSDMYRFGDLSPAWQSTAESVRTPGKLLPIAAVELQSNCYIIGSCR
jgi:hypothetical protein